MRSPLIALSEISIGWKRPRSAAVGTQSESSIGCHRLCTVDRKVRGNMRTFVHQTQLFSFLARFYGVPWGRGDRRKPESIQGNERSGIWRAHAQRLVGAWPWEFTFSWVLRSPSLLALPCKAGA